MSSFGKWYEEQKQGEEGGASSGSWFSDTFNTDQLLPLYEGMNAPVDLQSLRESMESRMPKKIMGMGYQQRFKVKIVVFGTGSQNDKDIDIGDRGSLSWCRWSHVACCE